MREDHFVGIDHREAARLDALFLRERQKAVEKLLVDLQHLHELHQAAVRYVQLTIETISAWIRFNTDFTNSREIDRPGEFRDVLRLRIARRESADTDAFLFRERDAMNFHILVPARVRVFQRVATLWTEIAFDINAVMFLDFTA